MNKTLLDKYILDRKKLNKKGTPPREDKTIHYDPNEEALYNNSSFPFYVDEEKSGEDNVLGTGGCLYRKICHEICDGRECIIYVAGNPEEKPVKEQDLIEAINSPETSKKIIEKDYPYFHKLSKTVSR